ncbi:MAG: hypothetical protein D6784_17730 [Chloroflexi bacterium]|nr:MAG: hypothetical protein D6784_17730 [Chloroflexota bacterium]
MNRLSPVAEKGNGPALALVVSAAMAVLVITLTLVLPPRQIVLGDELSPEVCGSCHTTLLFEWQFSRHGHAGVACVVCHDVHARPLHAPNTTNTLCRRCHTSLSEDHPACNMTDTCCTDCHSPMLPSSISESK